MAPQLSFDSVDILSGLLVVSVCLTLIALAVVARLLGRISSLERQCRRYRGWLENNSFEHKRKERA
jgi:hypothetical protein